MTAQITASTASTPPSSTERFHWFIDKIGEGSTVEWSTRDHDEVIAEVLAVREQFVEEFYAASLERREALVARTAPASSTGPTCRSTCSPCSSSRQIRAGTRSSPPRGHALPHRRDPDHVARGAPHREPPARRVRRPPRAARPRGRPGVPPERGLRVPSGCTCRRPRCCASPRGRRLASGRRIADGERVALLFTPANRDPEVFGADADGYNLERAVQPPVKPSGPGVRRRAPHLHRPAAVTGLSRTFDELADEERATAGMAVQILLALYAARGRTRPRARSAVPGGQPPRRLRLLPVAFSSLLNADRPSCGCTSTGASARARASAWPISEELFELDDEHMATVRLASATPG